MNTMSTPTTNGPEWLNQLAPDHAPPPLSMWLLAPGWWAVILLCVLSIAAIIYWQTRPAQRLRRATLRELKHLENMVTDDASLARDVEHVLRRYALRQFGHETVAKLSGEAWIHFVVAHGGTAWAGETGKSLLRAAYGGHSETGIKNHTKITDRSPWLKDAIKGAKDFVKGKR